MPNTEPSVDYVVVVNLLPQDATKAEKAFVLDAVHELKQTILQSADDAKRLVKPGKPGSKVVVWDADRWSGDIVAYLGVPVELSSLHPVPPPPPPPPPSQGSKLGPHVIVMGGDASDILKAGCAVAKFAGDWGSAPMAPESTFIVGRKVIISDDAQQMRARGFTPANAVHDFIYGKERQIDTYQSNPRIKFWEGHNEPVWVDNDGMAWYAQFEIERMKVMDGLGLRCVIGNFATGTPQMNLWPAFLPVCRYALEHGHVLGLHEYSLPWLWWMTGRYQIEEENCVNPQNPNRLWGWTTLRYRQVYDTYLTPVGLGSLPLVITEFSVDPMVSPTPDWCPQAAWKDLSNTWRGNDGATQFDYVHQSYPRPADVPAFQSKEQFYFEQLKWYDRQIRQDSYVIGATIFTYGSFGGAWERFDVQDTPVGDSLTQYVIESKKSA